MIQLNFKSFTFGTVLAGLLLGSAACQPSTTDTAATADGDATDTSADGALPGDGITVSSTHGSLREVRFQTEIVNRALQALGYETEEPLEIVPPTMYLAIANGDIHYTSTNWEKLHAGFYENSGGDDKLDTIGVITPNVLQGYQIDKATADAEGITSLEQLKDPELAKLFDSDGNGKANLTGCNPGWGCELVIENHLDAYGLRDTVEHDQGQYSALIADTITRYQQGEPVLFYAYTPMWLGNVLKPGTDTIWLEVPFTDLPGEQGEVSEADTTTAEGVNLGFAIDRMRIVANQDFIAENPAAEALFELVEIPIEDISAQNRLMYDGEDSDEDIARHVDEWIEDNQATFDGWIEAAKAAAES
ncbi:glycine betaine/L-proline ABC transporter substrate-binding protein ProX [Spirulina major CS-329]|uniref:glycine betaine/L-proline ABC transporter substrate-binding protein ProX n=1 Tax=Spirulina TaxID=1154 RepID=UPI00232BFEBD|nr:MULTISPECIES: glycine betaine/L-proline ABC transporter substrate-binding protein ProX [Spirulina]MDB9496387.1 glycine betaine/L-proline ABC transporter substrate-binding protein ProX [Spirulina subsalsa CS-330]MDB9504706.1 glycine betaine/L-proline ABC transporter substrate-binding protein ProX [Spirulina major CS-329]